MKQESFAVKTSSIQILLPDEITTPLPLFCFIGMEQEMLSSLYAKWEKRYQKRKIIAANIPVSSWNDDLSPWTMEPVFLNGEPFGGKADHFLSLLLKELLPEIEARYPVIAGDRTIIGYSLAGLFALYAAYQTDAFHKIGCLSGSLWFDGFSRYAVENIPLRKDLKAYFSLGDKESKTKNPAMASIGKATLLISEHLKTLLGEDSVFYEINAGGHTAQVENRFDKAVAKLIKV